jgi:hypothetical protein
MKQKIRLTLFLSLFFISIKAQTVGLFTNDSTAFNGYTLIAPLGSNQTYLIDNCGFIVNEWSSSQYIPGASTYLLDDGSILKTGNIQDTTLSAGGSGGILERFDWDDNLIWSYVLSDANQRLHHDIAVLPNGNILALVFDYRTYNEALSAGRDTSLLTSGGIWSEKVIELEPVGIDSAAIVWEWLLWDHLIQDYDSNAANFGIIKDNPQLVNLNYPGDYGADPDWIHANGLAYNEDLDQIMITAKNYHELWVIDHSTTTAEAAGSTGGNAGKGGDILYRWGNPATYDLGSPAIQHFDGQHDAHWIPNGLKDAGKIMVYNNRFYNPNSYSTVEIINPPVDSNGNYFYQSDSTFLPKSPEWSFQTPYYSQIVSNAQRLPNGNTLICNGRPGVIIEIDSNEQVVWKYVNPSQANGGIISQGSPAVGNIMFRAYRFAPEHPAFDGKDLTPTVPIELNPTPSVCQIYFPTMTDSEQWGVLDLNVIGNPFRNELTLDNHANTEIHLIIIDLSGRIVLEDYTSEMTLKYNTSKWGSGTYFLMAIDEENQAIIRKQLLKL